MAIIDQKKDIFGKISSLNVLTDSFPELPDFNSLSSINNTTDSGQFLIDLLNSLVGFKAIRDFVIDTITYKLPEIESAIKDGLKDELKSSVSCGINPSIPSWFKNGQPGVEMKVKDIDFFDIMKVNPDSLEGNLIYRDIQPQLNSTDLNTYLYYTIQENGTPENWGSSVLGTDILETTFLSSTPTANNIFKFTTTTDYDNKTLTEFNNSFIDSVSIFGSLNSNDVTKLINLIFDEIFGSISSSSSVNKSKKQLKKEAEINECLECIINSEDDVISDNFFSFDNETISKIELIVDNKKNGIKYLDSCGNIPVSISVDDISGYQNSIDSATTKIEELQAITSALDDAAETQASFSDNETDKLTFKTDFFIEIIKKLTRIIASLIISPKLMVLFAINHQIIYGQNSSYDGPIDFLKKNKKLVKNVTKIIRDIILELLLKLVLKILAKKLAEKFAGDEIEKAKNYVSIVLSYLGIPQEIIAIVRGI